MTSSLDTVLAAIDAANREDPTATARGPLALAQGELASGWLDRLVPNASPELVVAARAHHLRRWELQRSTYPDGRAGYLKWRKDNKAHQADSAAAILTEHGWPTDAIDRVRELLGRTKLRTDTETQTLEDVACLVFIETQFDKMVDETDRDHMVTIVAKTLKKMSQPAIELAGGIPVSDDGRDVIAAAAARLSEDA